MDYAHVYGQLHQNPKFFAGQTLKKYTNQIAQLVEQTKPTRLLDYGCGKGYQYLAMRLHEKWGGLLPHCYDIGVRQLATKPEGLFNGVICTDVLEHIEERDVPGILSDLFSYVDPGRPGFVFLGISCIPAKKKTLPDGRNVHICVKPPKWWEVQLASARNLTGFNGMCAVSYENTDED